MKIIIVNSPKYGEKIAIVDDADYALLIGYTASAFLHGEFGRPTTV